MKPLWISKRLGIVAVLAVLTLQAGVGLGQTTSQPMTVGYKSGQVTDVRPPSSIEIDERSEALERVVELWREALGHDLPAEAYAGWGWFADNQHLDDEIWLDLTLQTAARDGVNLAEPDRIAGRAEGMAPDPSYGTHFFQDLVESQIFSLAIHSNGAATEAGEYINWSFLREAQNRLSHYLPDAPPQACLKLIDIAAERNGQKLEVWMDGEKGLAFFSK